MLGKKYVEEMLNGEAGHCHVVEDRECAIPYCLPNGYMHLLSCCSVITSGTSFKTAMKHINLCKGSNCKAVERTKTIQLESIQKIEIGSDDFNNLAKTPEIFSYDKKLLLRMQPNVVTVACICGHKEVYYKIEHNHCKTCKYLNQMLEAYSKENCATKLSPMKNNCLPVITRYFSVDGTETSTKLNDMPRHMCKKIDNKFDKYIPFGADPVCFYVPKSDNVLRRELMKNFYEVDVFISSNIQEIRDLVKRNDRIGGWGGCETVFTI